MSTKMILDETGATFEIVNPTMTLHEALRTLATKWELIEGTFVYNVPSIYFEAAMALVKGL